MLYIQDPTYEDSKLLLDAILECCATAYSGAGAYAYVSADGVNLLMGDPIFQSFLSRGQFHLIIGMDEITNSRTLNALNAHIEQNPTLQVNAFLQDTTGSTFHAKFCWFECNGYGYVITGSGNMTQKGMQRNREAFELKRVEVDELNIVKSRWEAWLASAAAYILPLDNADVTARAEENIQRMRAMRPRRVHLRPTQPARADDAEIIENIIPETETTLAVYTDDELESWEFETNSRVLIAEIPRGERRWNQANFDADTFSTYFESVPGVAGQMALILRDVRSNGRLGEIRHRPPVSVASHNYRVELYVGRGTVYPTDGRVLGVFVKLSARTFLYSLVFPTNVEYTALQHMLNGHRQRANRLVRYQTNVDELQGLCPTLPILQYLSQAE